MTIKNDQMDQKDKKKWQTWQKWQEQLLKNDPKMIQRLEMAKEGLKKNDYKNDNFSKITENEFFFF